MKIQDKLICSMCGKVFTPAENCSRYDYEYELPTGISCEKTVSDEFAIVVDTLVLCPACEQKLASFIVAGLEDSDYWDREDHGDGYTEGHTDGYNAGWEDGYGAAIEDFEIDVDVDVDDVDDDDYGQKISGWSLCSPLLKGAPYKITKISSLDERDESLAWSPRETYLYCVQKDYPYVNISKVTEVSDLSGMVASKAKIGDICYCPYKGDMRAFILKRQPACVFTNWIIVDNCGNEDDLKLKDFTSYLADKWTEMDEDKQRYISTVMANKIVFCSDSVELASKDAVIDPTFFQTFKNHDLEHRTFPETEATTIKCVLDLEDIDEIVDQITDVAEDFMNEFFDELLEAFCKMFEEMKERWVG